VKLGEQEGLASVQLARYFGPSSAFFLVRAPLPLGLNVTKRSGGELSGAFVVEDVLPGGSVFEARKVLPGDVLQALTVVSGSAGLGSRNSENQEFLATMMGSLQKPTQTLVDASFLNTMEDFVDAVRTNTEMGDEAELTMIFERDVDMLPEPAEPLQPAS